MYILVPVCIVMLLLLLLAKVFAERDRREEADLRRMRRANAQLNHPPVEPDSAKEDDEKEK